MLPIKQLQSCVCCDIYDGKNVRKKDTDLLRELFKLLLRDTCTERLNTDKTL